MAEIEICYLSEQTKDLPLPRYMTDHSSGMDLPAAVDETIVLQPMERKLIPTGFAVKIPEGFEGQIRPRSGLASKTGVTVLNTPGTIDSDYRGEVKVLLINFGGEPVPIERGERIAQLVFAPVTKADVKVVETLSKTKRGDGGFGHTGS